MKDKRDLYQWIIFTWVENGEGGEENGEGGGWSEWGRFWTNEPTAIGRVYLKK